MHPAKRGRLAAAAAEAIIASEPCTREEMEAMIRELAKSKTLFANEISKHLVKGTEISPDLACFLLGEEYFRCDPDWVRHLKGLL